MCTQSDLHVGCQKNAQQSDLATVVHSIITSVRIYLMFTRHLAGFYGLCLRDEPASHLTAPEIAKLVPRGHHILKNLDM